ncbi:MAG: chorismate mutase [Calditrichaeota bacterium]|nr:MAG: chorismate mutase [Calditrichota bacterium]
MPDEALLKQIRVFRETIDRLDEEIVQKLNERARAAMEIGHIKRRAGWPVYVPTREEEVIAHVIKANQGPLSDAAIQRLFERIIDESRRQERESTKE